MAREQTMNQIAKVLGEINEGPLAMPPQFVQTTWSNRVIQHPLRARAGFLSFVFLLGCSADDAGRGGGAVDDASNHPAAGGVGNSSTRGHAAGGGVAGETNTGTGGHGGVEPNRTGSGGFGSGGAGTAGAIGDGGGGRGGSAPALPCDQNFIAEGYDGCAATLGEVETKYFPLPEGRQAKRLAVYFHGDTATEWHDMSGLITGVLDWALERDVVVAALLSPVGYSSDGPDERSFGALDGRSDTLKIGSAIHLLVEGLGVSAAELLVWSTSGGSWFLTTSFIPILGGRYQGLFALSCGGSSYRARYEWDPSSERSKAQAFRLWFNYGTDDFLAGDAASSRDHYRERGLSVSETTYAGAGHCEHDIIGPTLKFWSRNGL